MKTQTLYMAGAMLMAFSVWSCRDEHLLGAGEGKMLLEASIEQDVNVVSRALTAEEQNEMCNSALIWISDPAKGLLYRYNGLSSFPAEGLPLSTGHYAVEAWVGDSVPASWDKKRYRGYQDFEITRGGVTNVELTCPIRNTVVSVKYGDQVGEVLTDLRLTVSLNDGITDGSHSLTFEGLTPDKGYFMINSRTKGFTWVLEGTEASGKEFKKEGEYKDPAVEAEPFLAQTTEYIFNVRYGIGDEPEIGGGYLTIEVEPEPVEGTEKDVLIAMPPEIKGSGFDISGVQIGEPGVNERRAINITASSNLERVEIDGSLLTAAGLRDYNLLGMEASHITELEAKGITFQTFKGIEGSDDITNMRIILEETLFNSLPEGDYEMNITATDAEEQTSTAVFAISISLAPIMLNPVDEATVGYTTATLTATVKDPSAVSHMGFEVRAAGTAEWTAVSGTLEGNLLTGSAEGLKDGTVYEYRAVADAFTTKALSFTTKAYPQLPNASFEDWQDSKAPFLIYGAGQDMFWDSGNHGSATLSQNVTVPSTEYVHSGKYSILLESKYPNMFGIGRFAAGNMFAGKYLKTNGTDGILGWGRPWTTTPKALKGYVKYSPVAIDRIDKVAPDGMFTNGEMDKGIIYVALLTDQLSTAEGESFPVIVDTKQVQLFSKDLPNVLAYGELVFDGPTAGDGMIEFNIPIQTLKPGTVANIIVVATSSKGGDYFSGGVGSKMWLDDLELVY